MQGGEMLTTETVDRVLDEDVDRRFALADHSASSQPNGILGIGRIAKSYVPRGVSRRGGKAGGRA